jgi:hypothetical protein
MSWLRRVLQRRSDLARGVDADLMHANTRRFQFSIALLAFSALFAWSVHKVPFPYPLRLTLSVIAALFFISGVVLWKWALAEHRFLTKPDPEPPPSIFKD